MAAVQYSRGLKIEVNSSTAILSHSPAICLHPVLQVAAVSHQGHVAEYDLISGTKLGSSEANAIIALQYSTDASTLMSVTEENDLIAWEPLLWRRKILARLPLKPGLKPILLLSEGSQPLVYVYSQGGRDVNVFQAGAAADLAQKEKLDTFTVKKAIVAAANHPHDPNILYLLHEDSSVSANSLNLAQHSFVELWHHYLSLDAATLSEGILVAHQVSSDHTVLLVGAQSTFTALSLKSGFVAQGQGAAEPALTLLSWKGGGGKIVGAGYCNGRITCFTQPASGELIPACWQVDASHSSRLVAHQVEAHVDARGGQNALFGPGGTSGEWERLWLPKSSMIDSGAISDEVLVHSSGNAVACVKSRRHVSLTPLHHSGAATAGLAAKNQPSSTVVHTSVEYWQGKGEGISKNLEIESPLYYADNGLLMEASLVEFAEPHQFLHKGQKLSVVHLVHSAKQSVIILFFDAIGQGGDLESPWTFTAFSVKAKASKTQELLWTLPGTSAVFVGIEEEHYAVLCKQQAILYSSSAGFQEVKPSRSSRNRGPEPPALKKITLSGVPCALFQAPAWSQLPRAGEEDELSQPGNGLVMWSTADSLGISEMSTSNMLHRSSSLKGVAPAHTLSLLPQEAVIQVAWQNLLTGLVGSVLDDTGEGKASVVGAILTNRRLLIVSATLKLLVAYSVGPSAPSPTSLLWMGPALLFTTSANQVKQVSWDGSATQVCSLGGAASSSLVAALPDRLILLRNRRLSSGTTLLSDRQMSVLEPLLHGWASLAAMGVLPGGVWRARAEMGKLLRVYESQRLSSSLFNVLLTAGCGDVALALGRSPRAGPLTSAQEAAMRAAAGDWQDAVQSTLQAHRASPTYPRPPQKGSLLWRRLVMLGQTALAYGQTSAARQCWQAAEHWQELLPLCALQGDFSAISGYIANAPAEAKLMGEQLLSNGQARFTKASAVGAQATLGDWKVSPEVQTGSLAAGVAEIALELPTSSAAPSLVAINRQTDTTVPLPTLEQDKLEGFIGLGSHSTWTLGSRKSRTTGRSPLVDSFATTPSLAETQSGDGTPTQSEIPRASDNPFDQTARPQTPQSSAVPSSTPAAAAASVTPPAGSAGEGPPPLLGSFSNSSNQASKPPKSAFRRSKDDFYSSDSDDGTSENTSTAPSKRQFKIVIKDKSESSIANANLKTAASNIKLPPVATPMGMPWSAAAPKPPTTGQASKQAPAAITPMSDTDWAFAGFSEPSSTPPPPADFASYDPFALPALPAPATTATLPAGRGALPEDLFSEAPPPAPQSPKIPKPAKADKASSHQPTVRPPSGSAAQVQPKSRPPAEQPKVVVDEAKAFQEGIQAMEAGEWTEAIDHFRAAMHAPKHTKRTESAQYLAAVLLLEAQGNDPVVDARLSRFAAALTLQDRHKRALVQQACTKNMDARNFGYAAEKLMWLITTSVQAASPAVLAGLQQKLTQCEQKGTSNASVSADENLEDFPTIVSTAQSGVDVEDCLKGIL